MAVLMWDFSQIRVEGGLDILRARGYPLGYPSLCVWPPMTDERMTDAQWHCLPSFLSTCPDIRVGREAHGRLFVEAARGRARIGALWRQWPTRYGQWNSVYRRWAAWCDRGVWARRMAYWQTDPDLSAVRRDRRFRHPDPQAGGSPGPSPAPARDGRPAPRPHLGPGGSLDGRAAALPDRRPGL